MTTENLRIWNQVCETDPHHTTTVNQRGGFTAIDAQYQVQMATEVFGPCGTGWGYTCEHSLASIEGASMAVSDVTLWYEVGDGHKGSYGPIRACNLLVNKKGYVDEDAWKKATTDALTKLMSHLGFNADVFLGKFDDNRYVAQMREKFTSQLGMKHIDSLRDAIAAKDGIAGIEIIKELRADEGDEAWKFVWSQLDMKERQEVRTWGKPGERGA